MPYDRLSPMDASFLHIEDSVTHMHIGSVSIMEGPPPPYELVRDMVGGKLPLVKRYRQVVRTVPFDLGRPVWADDPYFNIEYHVRHTALPTPGNEGTLRNLVGRIMATQLDRAKPLWEIWMVEGLEDGQWALVSKVHHCMVDGVSGSDLLGLILDIKPDAEVEPADAWIPDLAPASWELAAQAVTDMVTSPFEMIRLIRAQTRVPRRAAAQFMEFATAARSAVGSMRSASSPSLNGPIGPHRRWVPSVVSVAEIKQVRRETGATFNDVVLAVITRGFRDLLSARGESLEHPIRTMVPVSVRPRDSSGRAVGDGTMNNKVSAMFADLPVSIADPIERLKAISAQMDGLKDSKQAVAGETLTHLSGFAPPLLLSLGGRVATKISQKTVNTVTTNVPGPQIPLYAAGRRMLRIFPYVPLGMQLRITVAIFSYDGEVTFGITGDYDSSGDIEVLADGIRAGMAELLEAAKEVEGSQAGQRSQGGSSIVDLRGGTRNGVLTKS